MTCPAGPARRLFVLPLLAALLLPLAAHPAAQDSRSLDSRISTTQDPDQLYSLALAALGADQPELARQALERVVALRPRFAGAWLDLALATYRSGDTAAALEHLEYLRAQFLLPPALGAQVDYWRQLWQQPAHTAARRDWQGELVLGIGHDNNANAGLAREHVALSLPGGSELFAVDPAYLPRPDRFGLLGITAQGPALAWGAGRLYPVIALRSKQFAREDDYSTLDTQLGLVYQQAAAGQGGWQASLFAQHYRLGGQTLFNSLRLAAQRSQPWQRCRWSGGAEVEGRQHQRVPSLGGTLISLSAGLGCPLRGAGQLSATLRAGVEQARPDRPGGNNHSTDLTLLHAQPLGAGQSLQASWQLSHTADQAGYSPLLQDNASRRLRRQALALGLRQTLGPAWELRLNYAYFVQRANLPLFEQQGHLLMLGLAYRFD